MASHTCSCRVTKSVTSILAFQRRFAVGDSVLYKDGVYLFRNQGVKNQLNAKSALPLFSNRRVCLLFWLTGLQASFGLFVQSLLLCRVWLACEPLACCLSHCFANHPGGCVAQLPWGRCNAVSGFGVWSTTGACLRCQVHHTGIASGESDVLRVARTSNISHVLHGRQRGTASFCCHHTAILLPSCCRFQTCVKCGTHSWPTERAAEPLRLLVRWPGGGGRGWMVYLRVQDHIRGCFHVFLRMELETMLLCSSLM